MKKRMNTLKFLNVLLKPVLHSDCIFAISKFCTKNIYWFESQHHVILIKQSRKEKHHTLHIVKSAFNRFHR